MSQSGGAVRFSVIRLDHPHVIGMTFSLKAAGAELVSVLPQKGPIADGFLKLFPDAPRANSASEILEDPSIQLIANGGIPNERAPRGLEVMRAGKDFLVDKLGFLRALAVELGLPVRHDVAGRIDVDFQPRGNRGAKWDDFFGARNLARIERICAEGMGSLGYRRHPDSGPAAMPKLGVTRPKSENAAPRGTRR